MTDRDPFEHSLTERLAASEGRVPGAVTPALPASGRRPVRFTVAAAGLVGASAIAAGLVIAALVNGPSGPFVGGPSDAATSTAAASVEELETPSELPSQATPEPSTPPISRAPGLLAVARDGDVFVRGADGSDLRQLTDDPEFDEGPLVWLLDGSQLVIERRATNDLYSSTLALVDPTTGSVTDLGIVFPAYSPMSWSPDGTRLAFGGDGASGSGIVLLDLRDGSLTQLTDDGGHGFDAASGAIWSPDGTLIAYQAFDGTSNDVLVVRVADGRVMSPAPDPTDDYPLRWVSVDGSLKLVFGSFRGTDENKFDARPWVVNVDGTGLQLLSGMGLEPSAGDPQPMTWRSPDGRWIASDCTRGVCIASTSGDLPLHVLPQTQGWGIAGAHLSWVPGGEYVVYETFVSRDDQRRVVVAISLPNGDSTTLTPDGVSESSPAWQPVLVD